MKARLVQIGNSQGIPLPKLLLEDAGMTDEVEIRARKGVIVIERVGRERAGLAKTARQVRERNEDSLVESPLGILQEMFAS